MLRGPWGGRKRRRLGDKGKGVGASGGLCHRGGWAADEEWNLPAEHSFWFHPCCTEDTRIRRGVTSWETPVKEKNGEHTVGLTQG